MSTTSTKRSHAEALADALAFQRFFDGRYEKWEFAGSLRRRCAEAADVDHVVIPRIVTKPGPGLFAEEVTVNLVLERLDKLAADGVVTKHIYGTQGPRWGPKKRGADFKGFNHEVNVVDAENWGSKLAICTGPEEFSKTLVTRLMIQRYRNIDGYVWRCEPCPCKRKDTMCKRCDAHGLEPVEKISVPTEREYFALASVPYMEPHARR
jgi:DNA polymerase/3'-5' exonuclease PolX